VSLSLLPVTDPVRVRIDSLQPGDRFRVWWEGDTGAIRGCLLRLAPGYARVTIRYPEAKVVDFVDSEGKGNHYVGHKTDTTEWSRGTLVIKEEGVMADEVEEGAVVETETKGKKKGLNLAPKGKAAKAAKPKANGKAKKALGPNEGGDCWCGCGEKVTRRFKPGHDARYYSQLKKIIAGELTFNKLAKPAQKELGDLKGVKAALAAHG
jgi:hypothetical protein